MTSRYPAYVILGIIVISSVSIVIPVFAVGSNSTSNNTNSTSGGNLTAYQILQEENSSRATTPPLTLATDQISYHQGDTIIIKGAVKDIQNATAITIRVVNPTPNLIAVGQLTPSATGSFTDTIKANGPLWTKAGNYTIIAQYGRYLQYNATFYFYGGNGVIIANLPVVNGTYQINEGSLGTYNIPYIIKGGTVQSMNVFSDQFKLEVTIAATSDGSITVDLPRTLIDAKVPANLTKDQIMAGVKINPSTLADLPFIVTVGGKQVNFTETKNDITRTLSIPFHQGDTTIDITGTIIIPEFGPIAVLVLAIAIISIIAVSAKTGLRLMPKY